MKPSNRGFLPQAIALIALLAFSGCGAFFQTLNSGADDDLKYGSDEGFLAGSSPGFKDARNVILNNCTSCHTDFAMYTEDQWEETGKVVPGSTDSSVLYTRLRGATTSGDMPPEGALAVQEIQAIENWILNM